MKNLLLVTFVTSFTFFAISQNQVGNNIDGEAPFDTFGESVSISGNGLIIAGGSSFNDSNEENSGDVRVFRLENDVWQQIGQSIAGTIDEFSGRSIVLSQDGSIIAIGAPGNNNSVGAVRVFENQNDNWVQIGENIEGENSIDSFGGFGLSINAQGTIVAIGSIFNDDNGENSGHVRVYQNINGDWTQIGEDIDGEAAGDNLGFSVDLSDDGTIVAVGANRNDGNGNDSGHVRVFENVNGTWTQIGSDIDGEAAADQFGTTVSISGDGSRFAAGAIGNDNANGNVAGHVRVFENQNGNWIQVGQDIDGEATNDGSGGNSINISTDGTIVAISAAFNDGNGENAGHVRIFNLQNQIWTQIGEDLDGEATGDFFGVATGLSDDGSTLVVGAQSNDTNGTDSGRVQVYDLNDILSVDDFNLELVKVFPNPTAGTTNIRLPQTYSLNKITIYNNVGQRVGTYYQNSINTSELSSGLYHAIISTNKGTFERKILVK